MRIQSTHGVFGFPRIFSAMVMSMQSVSDRLGSALSRLRTQRVRISGAGSMGILISYVQHVMLGSTQKPISPQFSAVNGLRGILTWFLGQYVHFDRCTVGFAVVERSMLSAIYPGLSTFIHWTTSNACDLCIVSASR